MNSIDHGDVSRHTGTHSSPEVSVQRAPILTNHPSRSITLPSPEFFGSIASGAHYAGALSPTHVEHSTSHLPHKRAPSLGADDPIVHETYQGVLEDVKELFCARPNLEIFQRRWRKDAVFEDPLSKCKGFDEYAPQFFALPKLFARSEQLSFRVLSATLEPKKLICAQQQEYTFRWIGLKKVVTSFVLIDLDEDLKITRLVDQWNGEELPSRWGGLWLRRLNARLTPWFISVPKQ